ncbi:MAG: type II toxin-antitoxin system RelE/ParE family toxin [Flavobacterium sp.]
MVSIGRNKNRRYFLLLQIKAGIKIARKIIIGIIDATINLDKNPEIGQIEELLKNRPQNFRYLIYTNYKIIYWYDKDKNRIVIANVFDTRQNPQKLTEII